MLNISGASSFSEMDFLANDMKQFPKLVTYKLSMLRKMDMESKQLMESVVNDENKLLEQLGSISKADPNYDETPAQEKLQSILGRRQRLLHMLDDQMKTVQDLYDNVDRKISVIDSCTMGIAHLFPQTVGDSSGGMKRKKKRKSTGTAQQSVEPLPVDYAFKVDPNEPVYCTCRQISFGNMIACENQECKIEWFHFSCVGLKAEPNEPWYCEQCRSEIKNRSSSAEQAQAETN